MNEVSASFRREAKRSQGFEVAKVYGLLEIG